MSDSEPLTAAAAVRHLGGVASRAEVLGLTTRSRLRGAIASGQLVLLTRGRYALPDVEEARLVAARLRGVLSHLSAAQQHGWETLVAPEAPYVCVPRGRNLGDRAGARVHWRSLTEDQLAAGATDPVATVLDCARDLSLREFLPVLDSALRERDLTGEQVRTAAEQLRGPGSARVRRRAALGDRRAFNAFESGLRALALEAGLDVVPQVPIAVGGTTVYPDLFDEGRALILEADSWTYHAEKSAFRRDIERYDDFVVMGYRVLRFTREHVVDHPDWVRTTLVAATRPGVPEHLRPRPGRPAPA